MTNKNNERRFDKDSLNDPQKNSLPFAAKTGRRALVAGGTGLVGRELLKILSKDPRYTNVTSIVRRAVSSPEKIDTMIVSFETLEETALPHADDAFCCLGTTRSAAESDEAFRKVDIDYVLAFARAAKVAGAKNFLLVSSIGADADSAFLYQKTKGETEAAVAGLGFESVSIVRPSLLLGHRDELRPAEKIAQALGTILGPLMIGPLTAYRPVKAGAVAAFLARTALIAPKGVRIYPSDIIGRYH